MWVHLFASLWLLAISTASALVKHTGWVGHVLTDGVEDNLCTVAPVSFDSPVFSCIYHGRLRTEWITQYYVDGLERNGLFMLCLIHLSHVNTRSHNYSRTSFDVFRAFRPHMRIVISGRSIHFPDNTIRPRFGGSADNIALYHYVPIVWWSISTSRAYANVFANIKRCNRCRGYFEESRG